MIPTPTPPTVFSFDFTITGSQIQAHTDTNYSTGVGIWIHGNVVCNPSYRAAKWGGYVDLYRNGVLVREGALKSNESTTYQFLFPP